MSTDATTGDGQQRDGAGTSERDARELMEALRSAPAEEIITELFSTMLSTAQVKLGRRDARVFIDLAAQALDSAGRYLPEELRTQVETALGQLRLAQVSAESRAVEEEPEPNDPPHVPTPPTGRPEPDPGPQPAAPTSRLWVPGR